MSPSSLSNHRSIAAGAVVLLAALSLLCPRPAEAATKITAAESKSTRQWHTKKMPALPNHVVAEKGKLTAFADWEHPKKRTKDWVIVPIYLINRTQNHYDVTHKDSGFYVTLEVQIDGKWKRAEKFTFGWCAMGSGTYILGPGNPNPIPSPGLLREEPLVRL